MDDNAKPGSVEEGIKQKLSLEELLRTINITSLEHSEQLTDIQVAQLARLATERTQKTLAHYLKDGQFDKGAEIAEEAGDNAVKIECYTKAAIAAEAKKEWLIASQEYLNAGYLKKAMDITKKFEARLDLYVQIAEKAAKTKNLDLAKEAYAQAISRLYSSSASPETKKSVFEDDAKVKLDILKRDYYLEHIGRIRHRELLQEARDSVTVAHLYPEAGAVFYTLGLYDDAIGYFTLAKMPERASQVAAVKTAEENPKIEDYFGM